jgi:alcohol dehydrogenase class IV
LGHQIAHGLGARFGVPHGVGAALSLPVTIELAAEGDLGGLEKVKLIGAAMGLEFEKEDPKTIGETVAGKIRDLMQIFNIPSVKAKGVSKEDFMGLHGYLQTFSLGLQNLSLYKIDDDLRRDALERVYEKYQ